MFSFFLDLKLPLRCIYKKNREARDMYVNVENVNFACIQKPPVINYCSLNKRVVLCGGLRHRRGQCAGMNAYKLGGTQNGSHAGIY